MVNQDNFKKVIYNLQYIRDLYDKMFPSAKDYIKFLRERINTLDNEDQNTNSYENFNEIKRNIPPKIFYFEERIEKSHHNFHEQDHWEDLSPSDITFYKDLTEHWLKTKTRRQRRIWNFFVLGVPKNSIAPRLKENTNFVTRTIKTLQKEFLDLIFKN
tara:strand:- start:1047 stop:1520 length:474 start_codon:yes stop_codon:yes gene_type:complete